MKSKIRKGIGENGSKLLSLLSATKEEVFTVKEAEKVSRIHGPKLTKLLHDLEKNGWLEHIERGKYLINPLESGITGHGTHPFIIARKLANPYYIGFQSALNYYGITEQISNDVFVVTTKHKTSLSFHNEKYSFVTLGNGRFFGMKEEWIGNMKFNISDKEKTIVDCLYMPKYSGGITEVLKAFNEKLDYGKLYEYALKMGDLATIKRLGYLLDFLSIEPSTTKKLLNKISGGYCLIDPSGPKTGNKNKTWRVIENVTDVLVSL